MPKTKRNRVIALTKVKKKGKSLKEELIKKIRDAADKYKRMFVFKYQHMSTNPFRKIQNEFTNSK